MCGKFEVEHGGVLSITEEAVATEHRWHLGLFSGFELFAGEEVAQSCDLRIDDDAQGNGLVVEVLDDKRLVVVRKECNLRRSLDIGSDILAHGASNDIEDTGGIVIKVSEIVGYGEHEERSLGIRVAQQNGISRNATVERSTGANDLPGIVGEVFHLGDDELAF